MVIKMSDVGQICPDVLVAFLGDYSARLSASDVSRITGVERRTVSRILNRLVDFNFMNYSMIGKNKLFYFDFAKESSKILVEIAEQSKALLFYLNIHRVAVVVQELVKISDAVVVFGSYASGKFLKDSDLDVLIFGADKKSVDKVKKNCSIELNYHLSNYGDFAKSLKEGNSLAIEIKMNHVIFGDVGKVSKIFRRNDE